MPPEAEAIEKTDTTAAVAAQTGAKTDAAPAEGADAGKATATDGKGAAAPAVGADGKPVVADPAKAGAVEDAGDGEEGEGQEKVASALDDGGDDEADAAAKAEEAKDGKDPDKSKKPDATFADVRNKAIERRMAKLEASLSKKLTAAELPKEMAKQKARLEAYLGRYGNELDALLAGYDANEKLRSGQHKQPLAEDATDEEKAAWRKDNGIPLEPKAYEVAKVPGHQWTEGDVPLLEDFKEVAHAGDFTQAQLDVATTWFAKRAQAAKEAIAERKANKDKEDNLARRDRRRDTWGDEAKPAFTLMERALKDPEVFPSGLGGALGEARLADGTRLVNHEAFEPFLYELALSRYGDTAMPSGDAAAAQLSSREEELNKVRNSDIQRYRTERNSGGQTMAEEMLEIQRKKGSRGKRAA